MLCLQTIGVSLSLPVVKGKPAQVALFLPAELAGCLKRSPGPSGCETLYLRGVFKRSSFSLYIFHLLLLHGESDCMLSVCSGAQRSFTFSDLWMWLIQDWPPVWLLAYCCNHHVKVNLAALFIFKKKHVTQVIWSQVVFLVKSSQMNWSPSQSYLQYSKRRDKLLVPV